MSLHRSDERFVRHDHSARAGRGGKGQIKGIVKSNDGPVEKASSQSPVSSRPMSSRTVGMKPLA
jgi:hypothetical protein